ncbi:16S rRNA-processing protein rimM [Candidatus Thiomargarita nelsonii]|uniref:Ribosome maturation factor RimM n=1 Tax=Candidatus Thiomargarita nelsonii TaxID=1003181 RepID=A0A0A6NZV9_9GAMM|nr:16S rRNA-processing protein rimM [Candidatus Thiomargarita nelsonii]
MITRVSIGRINGLYGVHGWIKVFSYTRPITNILNYSPWQLYQHGQWRTVSLSEGQAHGKGIIARLESIHNRDEAARLLGSEIAVNREQLPPTPKGEYYWADLIGLTVVNREDITLGQVEHLLETGANDVLVVKGERERLIPFLPEQVVVDVDLAQSVLRVDWDEDF